MMKLALESLWNLAALKIMKLGFDMLPDDTPGKYEVADALWRFCLRVEAEMRSKLAEIQERRAA